MVEFTAWWSGEKDSELLEKFKKLCLKYGADVVESDTIILCKFPDLDEKTKKKMIVEFYEEWLGYLKEKWDID